MSPTPPSARSPALSLLPPLMGAVRRVAEHAASSLTEPVTVGSRRNALQAVTSGRAYAAERAEAAQALDEHRRRYGSVRG